MKTLLLLLIVCAHAVNAAAPSNDAFGSRINLLSAASVATTGSNVDATLQSFEDTLDDEIGATVWWRWKAPASGWVRIDTVGSEIDTVLRIATGTSVSGTLVGFNDDCDWTGAARSSGLTFRATADTTYNIGIGGYSEYVSDEEDPIVAMGNVSLNITTGVAAQPESWPSALTFSPSSVSVSSAAANVTASLAVSGAVGSGDAEFSMVRPDGSMVDPPEVSGSTWTSGAAAAPWVFTIPRYSQDGDWLPVVELETPSGDFLTFGTAESGAAYLLPVSGIAQLLVVNNSGTEDITPPDVTAITVTPLAFNVNAAQAILPFSATVTDALGVSEVEASLLHPANPLLDLDLDLVRTGGTATNGTWTGNLTIPKEYPSGTYTVLIHVHDIVLNEELFGEAGNVVLPGGNRSAVINGGGAYWEWAYAEVYPDSADVGFDDDPNHDGIPNLNCYAFGFDPLETADRQALPSIGLTESVPQRLGIGYRKRVSATSGLTYTAEFSNNLLLWTPFTGTPVVTHTDATWDHVSIVDTETLATQPQRHARVKVVYADP